MSKFTVEIGLTGGHVIRTEISEANLRKHGETRSLTECHEMMSELALNIVDKVGDPDVTTTKVDWSNLTGNWQIVPQHLVYIFVSDIVEIGSTRPVQNKVTLEGTSVPNED